MSLFSIVITFQPELSNIIEIFSCCRSCGCQVLVVDNASDNAKELEQISLLYDNVKLICLDNNLGIASAQNIALKNLDCCDDDVIVFFDQDSSINPDFLIKAQKSYNNMERYFEKDIIVGPMFYNRRSQFEYPVIKLNSLGCREKIYPSNFHQPIEVSCIISSGMMVKKKIIETVGMMDDSLFIDYVDTEWCLRAQNLGVTIFVDPELVMEHEIGSDNINFLRWRVPVHSAARRYYRIRNSFILTNYSYIPKLTSLREILFSILHQLFLIVLTEEKKGHIKSLALGVIDGLYVILKHRLSSKFPM